MPTFALTGAPTQVDDLRSTAIQVQNTGAVALYAMPLGRQILPGATVTLPGWSQVATTLQTAGQAGSAAVTLTAGSPAAQPGPGGVTFSPGVASSMSVTVTGGSWFTDEGLTTAATWPRTISAPTVLYPAAPATVTVVMTVGSATQTRGLRAVAGSEESMRWESSAVADGHLSGQASEAQTGVSAGIGTYVPQPGAGVTGKDAQYPTARTKSVAGISAHIWQNNDSAAPDSGSRFYIVPRGTPSTGVGAVFKLFGNDYSANQTDYRDFGIYFSADQNSDTGTRANGVFWLNGKVNGTYAGLSPDIGFSMQDGQYVAGRVALATVNAVTPNIQWVFGPGVPRIGTKVAVAAEIQGDFGMGTTGDTAFRWQRTDSSTTDNALTFQRAASGGNLKVTLGSNQRMLITNSGSLVLGNGSSAFSTASTDGFLYLNSMAGTPSGAPTAQGAAVPIAIDTTGSKLWAYIGGAWKSVTLA